MTVTIRIKRGTATQWSNSTTPLTAGELGYDITNKVIKIGDGTTLWPSLQPLNKFEIDELSQDAIYSALTNFVSTGENVTVEYNDAENFIRLDTGPNVVLASDLSTAITEANEYTDLAISSLGNQIGEDYVPISLVGNPNGVAQLGVDGYVPDSQISPSIARDSEIITSYNNLTDKPTIEMAAPQWTANHFQLPGGANTRYLAGDVVYSGGNIYVANFDNESLPVTNTQYWTNIGPGKRLNVDGRDIPNMLWSNILFKPTLFDGNYNSLSNKPTLFSGSYTDLTDKPTIATDVSELTDSVELLIPKNNTILTGITSVESLTASVDITSSDQLYVGPGAATFETSAILTDTMAVFRKIGGEASFAQLAVQNATATSSSDIIAYMDNGNDSEGWVGIGIAGSEFDDTTYGITVPGDGYLFHNTKNGDGRKGNLVIATGDAGTENKIILAAGGFASGNTQMEITPDVNVHIEIPTPSTSSTTGALTVVGGVGIQGDMNIEGNVSIQGTITFGGGGTTVETENLSVTDPFIFVGASNSADIVDLGLIGEYKVGANTKYAGIIRDASDGVIKIFKDATTKPASTVDFEEAGLGYADFRAANITAASAQIGSVTNTEISYLANIHSNIQTQLDSKLSTTSAASIYAPIDSPTFTGTVSGVNKLMVGLGSVDNTSDLNKPISTATQTALNSKLDSSSFTYASITIPVYDAIGDLPPAAANHGRWAHVHEEGAMYFAHGGAWYRALSEADLYEKTNAQSGSYTIQTSDLGKLIEMSNGGTITISDSTSFPVGFSVDILQTGSSQVTIAGNGFTPNATPGLKLRSQWSGATLLKRGSNSWVVLGDLAV